MFEQLIEKLQDPKAEYITLETTPRHDASFTPVIDTIEKLGIAEYVDGFSTTDNPLAKLKFNSIIAAMQLQERFKKPVLATMSMRDRNKIALQSDLLGANSIDVRAVLALTGDPAKISDQPASKGVFEADSTMLLDIIKCFNAGIDYAGREFGIKPRPIYPFAVSNAFAKNPKTLLKKFTKKLEHGALGIITQPVFDTENALKLLELFEEAKDLSGNGKGVLILGLFPVTKLRTAQFLASHVPGIDVPKKWIDELYEAHRKGEEEEEKRGLALSSAIFESVREIHPKIHLMTANRFTLAKKLLRSRS
ncbi:5,10-methylenetetrahydrofolate reductase [Hydrogenimonas sp.]|nr:5,10-methylenetetrahydrofolate reductase [Hydrogenimonas sp.]